MTATGVKVAKTSNPVTIPSANIGTATGVQNPVAADHVLKVAEALISNYRDNFFRLFHAKRLYVQLTDVRMASAPYPQVPPVQWQVVPGDPDVFLRDCGLEVVADYFLKEHKQKPKRQKTNLACVQCGNDFGICWHRSGRHGWSVVCGTCYSQNVKDQLHLSFRNQIKMFLKSVTVEQHHFLCSYEAARKQMMELENNTLNITSQLAAVTEQLLTAVNQSPATNGARFQLPTASQLPVTCNSLGHQLPATTCNNGASIGFQLPTAGQLPVTCGHQLPAATCDYYASIRHQLPASQLLAITGNGHWLPAAGQYPVATSVGNNNATACSTTGPQFPASAGGNNVPATGSNISSCQSVCSNPVKQTTTSSTVSGSPSLVVPLVQQTKRPTSAAAEIEWTPVAKKPMDGNITHQMPGTKKSVSVDGASVRSMSVGRTNVGQMPGQKGSLSLDDATNFRQTPGVKRSMSVASQVPGIQRDPCVWIHEVKQMLDKCKGKTG
jgi:hypothetical protein